jgi:hypothetical protein
MLANYVMEVQELLNDEQGQFFSVPRLHRYINRARRRIAYMSGCIRIIPPGTVTVPQQEIYPFDNWISLVQDAKPGVRSILACRSVAIALGSGGWKPMWRRIVWSDFQARLRIYNGTFFGTLTEPGWWAQYGAGPAAQIYLAPVPAMAVPMEVDLTCIPEDLLTDDDPEPIPPPWDDAVMYWAATLALMGQQRREDAQAMAVLFNNDMPMCASVVCPQMLQTPYGAVLRSA